MPNKQLTYINRTLFYSFTAFSAHLLQQQPHCQKYVDAIEQNALSR